MKFSKINDARIVVQRFLDCVDDLDQVVALIEDFKEDYSTLPPKESGAVRRASMDLTRALAEMRKP